MPTDPIETSKSTGERSAVDSSAAGAWLADPSTILGLLSALLVVAYGGVFWQAAQSWSHNPDYSHGFLVPLVAGYFIWQRRDRLAESFAGSQGLGVIVVGIALIVVALGMRAIGMYTRVLALELLSLVPLLVGLTILFCGYRSAVSLAPAFLFLLFMIPLPGAVMNPVREKLQSTATQISVFGLQTAGVPVMSRGNVIVLPDTEVGVEEACSGLRILVSFAAVVVAVTMFIDRGWIEKSVLLLSILPLALLINAGRIVLVAAAQQYQPGWADRIHDIAGATMMVVAVGCLWGLIKFMDLLFDSAESSTWSASVRPA